MAEAAFNMDEIVGRIGPLLTELLERGGFHLTFHAERTTGAFERDFENPDVVVTFEGQDADLLIENKAELLKAIEHFVFEAIDLPQDHRERVLFDCRDYRMMRIDELQLAARAAAERVRRTGVPYQFNPMNSRERRVIHMALRGEQDIVTQSEGVGQQRKVVVRPAQSRQAGAAPARVHPPSR